MLTFIWVLYALINIIVGFLVNFGLQNGALEEPNIQENLKSAFGDRWNDVKFVYSRMMLTLNLWFLLPFAIVWSLLWIWVA